MLHWARNHIAVAAGNGTYAEKGSDMSQRHVTHNGPTASDASIHLAIFHPFNDSWQAFDYPGCPILDDLTLSQGWRPRGNLDTSPQNPGGLFCDNGLQGSA